MRSLTTPLINEMPLNELLALGLEIEAQVILARAAKAEICDEIRSRAGPDGAAFSSSDAVVIVSPSREYTFIDTSAVRNFFTETELIEKSFLTQRHRKQSVRIMRTKNHENDSETNSTEEDETVEVINNEWNINID